MLYVSLMNDRRSNNINYTKRNSKPYFSNKYRTNLFPTFFGQRLQASIYRYLKHLLSETIHPKVDHFSDNDAEGTKRQSDVNSNNQRLFVYPFIDKSEHPCKNTARNSQDNGRDNMYLYKLVFLVRVQPLIF